MSSTYNNNTVDFDDSPELLLEGLAEFVRGHLEVKIVNPNESTRRLFDLKKVFIVCVYY